MVRLVSRFLSPFHLAVVASVLAVLSTKAALEFCRDWDFLAYHLPDALRRTGLTTFREPAVQWILNQAFPPLPHILQGLFVKLSGRMSLANALNAVSLLGLAAVLSRMFRGRFSARWFLTACLAVPLVVAQYTTGYIDLAVGAALTFALASLVFFELELAGGAAPGAALRRSLPLIAASFGVAMLMKYHAWPIVLIYYVGFIIRLAFLPREARLRRRELFFTAFALFGIVSFWPVRNFAVFGNPVYPYRAPFVSELFPSYFMAAESSPRNTPNYLREASPPLRYVHSAFELNRLVEWRKFFWTFDQYHLGDKINNHQRMGGWFFATFMLLFAAFFASVRSGAVPMFPAAIFFAATAAVGFLPQSHELRYWLFVPVSLAMFTGLGLDALSPRLRAGLRVGFALLAIYVVAKTATWSIDLSPPESFAPDEARAYWENPARPLLVCDRVPQTIYWAGPTFKEFPVEACYSNWR